MTTKPRFRILTRKVRQYRGRDIVVVQTNAGKQAFYRRTGRGRSSCNTGAQAGQWAPFYGLLYNQWIVKPQHTHGRLYRYGTLENRLAGKWLDRQKISKTDGAVAAHWRVINSDLRRIGIIGKMERLPGGATTYIPMDKD